jgi:hypothetical protein
MKPIVCSTNAGWLKEGVVTEVGSASAGRVDSTDNETIPSSISVRLRK